MQGRQAEVEESIGKTSAEKRTPRGMLCLESQRKGINEEKEVEDIEE